MANQTIDGVGPGNRGMALLLVVSTVALLTVVIMNFGRSMQLAVTGASHFQQSVLLESMANSGLDMGLAVLLQDARLNDSDSLPENWARLGETPIDPGVGQGGLRIFISDLDGRFPVHSLVEMATEGQDQEQVTTGLAPEQAREILLRLLQSGRFAVEDETGAREIVDSLTDWIDGDEDELDYGAEASYYDSLENPVVPRNGPVDFIDELLEVNGISQDLLYGNDEKEALAEYIDVQSRSAKININTAPVPLIQALDELISEDEVDGLEEFRRSEDNIDVLSDSSWFTDYLPSDIDGPGLQSILTAKSSHFVVRSEARYQERFMTVEAIIERLSENELKIVSLRME